MVGLCGRRLLPLLRHLKTLAEDGHEVEPFSLEVDSLALQVVVDYFLLFADDFGAA